MPIPATPYRALDSRTEHCRAQPRGAMPCVGAHGLNVSACHPPLPSPRLGLPGRAMHRRTAPRPGMPRQAPHSDASRCVDARESNPGATIRPPVPCLTWPCRAMPRPTELCRAQPMPCPAQPRAGVEGSNLEPFPLALLEAPCLAAPNRALPGPALRCHAQPCVDARGSNPVCLPAIRRPCQTGPRLTTPNPSRRDPAQPDLTGHCHAWASETRTRMWSTRPPRTPCLARREPGLALRCRASPRLAWTLRARTAVPASRPPRTPCRARPGDALPGHARPDRAKTEG